MPSAAIHFTQVTDPAEVRQILDLQAQNLAANLSPETRRQQGFVTVRHQPEVLLRMNQAYPSVIAKAGDQLAGYCLVMLRDFGNQVPELIAMFAMLDQLSWQGRPLRSGGWFVMGQVCVAEAYRGQGVFDGMYGKLREVCHPDFDFVITEVAARNTRSLRAHERVGFEPVHIYEDRQSGETWHVIAMTL